MHRNIICISGVNYTVQVEVAYIKTGVNYTVQVEVAYIKTQRVLVENTHTTLYKASKQTKLSFKTG